MTCFSGAWKSPEAPEGDWKLETLGRIATGVAHDFNNILAAISGFAELILACPEEADAASFEKSRTEFARLILEAAETGQTTVRELQNFARPAGTRFEALDMHALLRHSMAMAKGSLSLIHFTLEFSAEPAVVMGSRGLLQNVFINLFLNARDAMPDGGTIGVRTRIEGNARDTLMICIRDQGTGMSEEVQRRMFDRRFTTKGRMGSGLGLANVLDTVTAHGGRIEVDSRPGQGTEIRILLPSADAK